MFIRLEHYKSAVKLSIGSLDIEARTLYGRDADDWTPYMSQLIVGRLRFHLFWRGDEDPDPHDHPWEFWTFPLRSYVEEVTDPETHERKRKLVTAFHWHHRPATYTHRVLWPAKVWHDRARERRLRLPKGSFYHRERGPIPTIVWTGPKTRSWGFLKTREGKWCWVAWRDYIFNGGKNAPCE